MSQPLTTLGTLVGLQFPCLVSRAVPNTSLSACQQFGFPFNMSNQTLERHFSFSPLNILEGRYYTLVTNLFNHTGNWLRLCAGMGEGGGTIFIFGFQVVCFYT